MSENNFQVNNSDKKIVIIVDNTEILNLDKSDEEGEIRALTIDLSKEQLSLMKNKFSDAYDKINAYLDKIEVPYKYRWTNETEIFDGALTFNLPLSDSIKLYVIITYGRRWVFKKDRKRLLILTRLLHGEKELPGLSRHGQTTVMGEPVGTDNYDNDKSLVMLIRRERIKGRDYYSSKDYPKNIHPTLEEFVTTKSGDPLTQRDFIKGAWNRLVFHTTLKEVEKLIKYALIRTFI